MDLQAVMDGVRDDAGFDTCMDDPAFVRAALDALGAHLQLSEPLQPPPRGSAVVGLGRDDVVKMMPPHSRAFSETELACLQALHRRLPVPTPEVLDTGELRGWTWIRMCRLGGEELTEVWPELSTDQRLDLATQLGEALRVLHGLEAPAEVERLDWQAWRASRLATLEATQRARGCPEPLLDGLRAFVEAADTDPGRVGWLHTEVMREHLLVERAAGGWRLSGLFDFEPSWVAPVDYELASVGLFVSAGEAPVLREVRRGCGSDAGPRRLFALAMLHRYADLAWYHRRLGGPQQLGALAERWFGA